MSDRPVYTEQQVRRWLGFLARNMQSHGQSMFLLEQLQPSWLTNERQIVTYRMLSRAAMYGALAGLLCIDGNSMGKIGLSDILYGLLWIAGMPIGIALLSLLSEIPAALRRSHRLSPWFRTAVLAVCVCSQIPIRYVVVRPVQWILGRTGRTLDDDIRPVEHISWSLAGFCKGLAFLQLKPSRRSNAWLNWLLILTSWTARIGWLAFVILVTILAWRSRSQKFYEKAVVDFLLWLPSLIGGIFSAIQTKNVELKATPNLGIRLSGRNALVIAGMTVPVLVINYLLCVKLAKNAVASEVSLVPSLLLLLVGIPILARLGLMDYLAHYSLRLLLWIYGYAPLDYVRFLDYAAGELGFLQKVGGGYVFMHRYLQEYFAGSEQTAVGLASGSVEPLSVV